MKCSGNVSSFVSRAKNKSILKVYYQINCIKRTWLQRIVSMTTVQYNE